MNRGQNGFPAGRGLTLSSLGDVGESPAGVLDLKRYGEQPAYSPRDRGFVSARGPLFNPLLSTFNAHAGNLWQWHRAVGNVRAGTADAVLCVVGDSTSTGRGDDANAHATSWPIALQAMMKSYYMPSSYEATWGTHAGDNGAGITAYDPRVTLGSGWTTSSGNDSGGGGYSGTTGAAGALTFTPAIPFDRVRVWMVLNNAIFSTVVCKVDGASVGTTTAGVSGNSVGSSTFTTTLATHTITLDTVAGGSVGRGDVYGIDVWDSTKKGLRVFMKTRGTTKAADHVAGNWDARAAMAPALTVINLALNDVETGLGETPLGAYKASIQSIINTAKNTGDAMLVLPNWSSSSAIGYARTEPYHRMNYELAQDNDLPLLDLRHRWPSYTKQTASTTTGGQSVVGLSGTLHPFAGGYQDVAQAIFNVVR